MPKKWRTIAAEEAKNHPLYGVSGWLLLLIACMVVIGPLLGALSLGGKIIQAERDYLGLVSVNEWGTYKIATWSVFIGSCFLTILAGIGLSRKREWIAVERARAILWLTGPGAVLCIGVLVPLSAFGSMESIDPRFIGTLLASFLPALIWSRYLYHSKRVRITFASSVLEDSIGVGVEPHEDRTNISANSMTTSPIAKAPISRETAGQASNAKPIERSPLQTKINSKGGQIDERFWAMALAEYDSQARRPGLWARLFSEAEGNESTAKANYLKHRANELALDEHQRVEQERLARISEEEREKLAKMAEEKRAYEALPKGHCPNCDTIIPLASKKCLKCPADFTGNDGWRPLPL